MELNSSRYWLEIEIKSFSDSLPANSLILDAGAGNQMYKKLFTNHRYESADFCQVAKYYEPPTYICDLSNIPTEDSRFDAIIFSQVLEHLTDPLNVLNELNRVLKPTGKLFLTVPFIYEEHEQPHDYYRYTQYGLKYLFEKSNFNIKDLRRLEGYLGTTSYQLSTMRDNLPKKIYQHHKGIKRLFNKISYKLFLYLLNKIPTMMAESDIYKRQNEGIIKNHLAILTPK